MDIIYNHFKCKEEYLERFHNKLVDDYEIKFSEGSMSHHVGRDTNEVAWVNNPVMYAEINGEIAGVLFYVLCKVPKYRASIHNIITISKYRGQGAGFGLMKNAVYEAFKSGRRSLRTRCEKTELAIPFYNKLGMPYFGVTAGNDALYSHFTLPSENIEDIKLLRNSTIEEIIGTESIYRDIMSKINVSHSERLKDNMLEYIDKELYLFDKLLTLDRRLLK